MTNLCLGYVSSAVAPFDGPMLQALLARSKANNASRGVTGMLAYHDGNFLQFLEGEAGAVEQTFAVIARDPRHRGIIEICRQPIDGRAFPEWSMALADPSRGGAPEDALCRTLRDVRPAESAGHIRLIRPFLDIFRAGAH